MGIRAREAAEVGAVARADAGDEEGHVLLLRLRADRDEQAEGCDEGFHAEVNTAAAKIFGMRLVAALLLFLLPRWRARRTGPRGRSASSCRSRREVAPTSWGG